MNDEPNIPKRNVFARNISAGGVWDDIYPAIRRYQTVKDNLVFDDDKDWVRLEKDATGRPVRLNFKDRAAVAQLGFEDLPLTKMGLYPDPRRATWPVRDTTDPIKLPHDKKD